MNPTSTDAAPRSQRSLRTILCDPTEGRPPFHTVSSAWRAACAVQTTIPMLGLTAPDPDELDLWLPPVALQAVMRLRDIGPSVAAVEALANALTVAGVEPKNGGVRLPADRMTRLLHDVVLSAVVLAARDNPHDLAVDVATRLSYVMGDPMEEGTRLVDLAVSEGLVELHDDVRRAPDEAPRFLDRLWRGLRPTENGLMLLNG